MVEIWISHVGIKRFDMEMLNESEPPPKLKSFEFVMHAKVAEEQPFTVPAHESTYSDSRAVYIDSPALLASTNGGLAMSTIEIIIKL
jgi:hypothetical protein